jgi:hypothetical protein
MDDIATEDVDVGVVGPAVEVVDGVEFDGAGGVEEAED